MKNLATKPRKFQYLEILKAMERHHFLTLNQFLAIFRSRPESMVRSMILKLWKHKFLERLILTRAAKKLSIIYVFALSRHGARQLVTKIDNGKIFYLKSNDTRSSLFLEHTLLLNDFRICLEKLTDEKNGANLVFWTQAKQDLKIRINA